MLKSNVSRMLLVAALFVSCGHAASNMKFDSMAKYRLVTTTSDKLVVEARIYTASPGWAFSEVLRMTPVEYLPFEYKGVVMTMTPEEALQMCGEVLNAPIFVKALEMLEKQNKPVDIGGYMAVIESTLQARVHKLNMLMCGATALGLIAVTFAKFPKCLAKRFIPEWLKDAADDSASSSKPASEPKDVAPQPAATAPAAASPSQAVEPKPAAKPNVPNSLFGLGWESWALKGALATAYASGTCLLFRLKSRTIADARAMTQALLTYQNRTMCDAAVTKAHAQSVAKITRSSAIADMAETLA